MSEIYVAVFGNESSCEIHIGDKQYFPNNRESRYLVKLDKSHPEIAGKDLRQICYDFQQEMQLTAAMVVSPFSKEEENLWHKRFYDPYTVGIDKLTIAVNKFFNRLSTE